MMKYLMPCLLILLAVSAAGQHHKKKQGKTNGRHAVARTGMFNEGGGINIKLTPEDTTPKPDSAKLRAIAEKKEADRPDSLLNWNTSLALSWDDFRAKPDPNKKTLDAFAVTALKYEYKTMPTSITVKCVWNRKRSWKRPNANLTTALLIHEKVHFNITELHARKLRAAFSTYEHTQGYVLRELNAIFARINAEKDAMQAQYDLETENGRNAAKQAEWNMKVSTVMHELKEYASE